MKSGITFAIAALVGLGCLLCFSGQSDAALITFQVKALDSHGDEVSTISVDHVGQMLELRVYALISGSGANDGLNKSLGTLASNNVAGHDIILGDMALGTLGPGLTAVGSSVGALHDLGNLVGPGAIPQYASIDPGDGDKDVGVNTTGSSTTGFIIDFAGTSVYAVNHTVLLYSNTFMVKYLPTTPEALTQIQYTPRYYSGGTTALKAIVVFKSDNVAYSLNGDDSRIGYEPLGVSYIPEPATLALMGLGLVGLLRRRR